MIKQQKKFIGVTISHTGQVDQQYEGLNYKHYPKSHANTTNALPGAQQKKLLHVLIALTDYITPCFNIRQRSLYPIVTE